MRRDGIRDEIDGYETVRNYNGICFNILVLRLIHPPERFALLFIIKSIFFSMAFIIFVVDVCVCVFG